MYESVLPISELSIGAMYPFKYHVGELIAPTIGPSGTRFFKLTEL